MIDTKTKINTRSQGRVQGLARKASEGLNARREASGIDWRKVREQNAAKVAQADAYRARKADTREDLTWLDLATRSVAPYEVLA